MPAIFCSFATFDQFKEELRGGVGSPWGDRLSINHKAATSASVKLTACINLTGNLGKNVQQHTGQFCNTINLFIYDHSRVKSSWSQGVPTCLRIIYFLMAGGGQRVWMHFSGQNASCNTEEIHEQCCDLKIRRMIQKFNSSPASECEQWPCRLCTD